MPVTFLDEKKQGVTFLEEDGSNKANELLNQGLEYNFTPEQSKSVNSILSSQDREDLTASLYYTLKTGTNKPLSRVSTNAHIHLDYGDNATSQVANQQNKKAAKREKAGAKELVGTGLGAMRDVTSAAAEGIVQIQSGLIGKLSFRKDPKDWTPSKRQIESAGGEEAAREIYSRAREKHLENIKTGDHKEILSEIGKDLGEVIIEQKPEWVKESKRIVETELSSGDMNLLKQGASLLSLNLGNMVASGNAMIGLPVMYFQERKSMSDTLVQVGLSAEERESAEMLYGALSGAIEYVEHVGRIKSAFGGKKVKGKIASTIISKLSSGTINVGEEVAQQLLFNVIYNDAVTKHNEATGNDVPLKEIPEGLADAAEGSLAMTTVMEALGLSVKGIGKAKTAWTGGDVARTKKQHTNEQIAQIVQNDPVLGATPETTQQATEALQSPSETSPDVLNDITFGEEQVDGPADKNQTVKADVSGQGEMDVDLQEQVLEMADKEQPIVGQIEGDEVGQTEEIDAVGLEQAMREDKTVDKPLEAQPSDTVGLSKKWDAVKSTLAFDKETLKPERVAQTETIKKAFDKGLHTKTDQIMQKVKKKKAITHEEVGGLLIRKTEIVNEIESVQSQMSKTTDEGQLAELGERLNQQIDLGIEITESIRKGATEVARSLAAMAMQMDKKTFDLVSVSALAQATKGSKLTAEELSPIQEKVEEREAVTKEREKAEKGELDERESIIDEVERAHRRLRKKGRKKADKNADVKLIRKRQDKIFDLIDEINKGKPASEKVKKVQEPDSEGYLEMINNLRKELTEIRKVRGLESRVSEMEADIESGDIAKYDKKPETKEQSEQVMLLRAREFALGKEITRQIAELKPKTLGGKFQYYVWDPMRNIKLTADMGHLLRQGGVVMSNPKMWTGDAQRFFSESLHALIKEDADLIDAQIMSHKNYDRWKLAGLAMIEEGKQLDAREEIIMQGALSKASLGVGKAQRAFARTQITGTNLLRLLAAESYLGDNTNPTLNEMRDIAKVVNILAGRGATVKDPKLNSFLNKILTSPSFTASRFQAPFVLAHKGADGKYLFENKELRKRVIEDGAWFLGTRLALMALFAAALPEAEIGDDPDHWTYGRLIVKVSSDKYRVYNPWAGIQSVYGALYRGASNKKRAVETLSWMTEGRLHPAVRLEEDLRTGDSLYDGDITRGEMLVRSILPISVDGVLEAIREDTGVFDVIAAVATDVIGVGSILVDKNDLSEKP